MCYGFYSIALIHTGVNWVYWGTLTEDSVSVKDNMLEKVETAKLFHPKSVSLNQSKSVSLPVKWGITQV